MGKVQLPNPYNELNNVVNQIEELVNRAVELAKSIEEFREKDPNADQRLFEESEIRDRCGFLAKIYDAVAKLDEVADIMKEVLDASDCFSIEEEYEEYEEEEWDWDEEL